jgi:putative transcriptional regulator
MLPMTKPTPEAVLQARKEAGMTQELAGQVLGTHNRQWRLYEAGDRAMSAPLWELFLLKTNQHPTMTLVARPQ